MAGQFENWVFVGLGSNLGDSPRVLSAAAEALRVFTTGRLLRSSLWQSTPVDCPPGSPDFLNAVVGFIPKPDLTPEGTLAALQRIERAFGRQPDGVWHGPRSLDLDLLVFGTEVRSTTELSLPHPRAALRRFVLEPWNELSPELVLPVVGQSVSELLNGLPSGPRVQKSQRLST